MCTSGGGTNERLSAEGELPDHHRPRGGSRWLTTKLTITLAIAVAAAILPASFSPQSASAYELCGWVGQSWVCGARWNSHSASWHDNTGWTGSKQTAVSSAGAKWNAVPDTFSLTYDSSPYGPYQATVGLANLDVLGIPYPGATWTYTAPGDIYNINGAQSLLNSTWTWNTTGYFNVSTKSADVLTVILHEMGHWMFLNHPCATQPGAVMCSQPVAKWNLTNDDIQGMQALYY
ncbi:MAG: matrixin family metalloprotease [Dehalococcoidia bacterium]|nr:matrixin family metalloprotease [Dehalococcoidia bacterium]